MLLLSSGWLAYLIWIFRKKKPHPPISETVWRRTAVLLLLTTAAVFFIYALPLDGYEQSFPIDDSYITLSAARNLAYHNQFALNPDAPLAGITSPLHVALVGGLAKLLPLTTANRLIGLLAFLALTLGIFAWARQLGADFCTAAAAAAATALCGPMAFGALNGLETVPFTALLIWSCVTFELAEKNKRYWYLTGVLVGLTILTRPEGWFFAAALYLTVFYRHIRRDKWTNFKALTPVIFSGLIALLVVAPYLLANFLIHGSLFPLTVTAKQHFFSDGCRPFPAKFMVTVFSFWLAVGPYLVLLPFLFWSRTFLRRIYPWLFIVLFYFAYTIRFPGALGHYWGRYQHPLLPFLLVGSLLGAQAVYQKMRRTEKWLKILFVYGLAIFIFATAGIGGKLQQKVYRGALENAQAFLMSITDWIQANSAPGDVVATHDVGALYYFGQRSVLDLVGLSDPEIAEMYANEPPLCQRDMRERRVALYKILKRRKPKIIYFSPKWDSSFLGLTKTDQGRHMVRIWNLPHKYQLDEENDVTVYEYDFYLCDWQNIRGQ